jgi:hypothetical protein
MELLADGQILALRLSRIQTLTAIVLRRGTGKLPGAGERKEAPRSAAKGRATDERSDASNFKHPRRRGEKEEERGPN